MAKPGVKGSSLQCWDRRGVLNNDGNSRERRDRMTYSELETLDRMQVQLMTSPKRFRPRMVSISVAMESVEDRYDEESSAETARTWGRSWYSSVNS